ncbi:MFS transporter [Candidatus Halobonum tyrrellensis]|uniref:Major facilitator superfamily transporter n=1 Tax=Candidatus Halobonum tyrrellensis G22 TaxID=1324957 RepID=V4GUR3_9EURY|nr:MFS transporter [Candidatus Halobonum tyrrellensis]ESP88866.1 major facilitator superfamily transporter [Candidatus Halobonum tyrrellensis G22]
MSRARLFGTLCGAVFLVNMARVVFAPLLSEFIAVFGMTEGTAGLLATSVWMGSALLRVPTGWLLTRFSRHRVVLGTGALLTAASAFVATADSVPILMVGAVGMGLASGSYFVAANPLVSELFPDRVGRAMGVHGTAAQLAAASAAPFATLMLGVTLWSFAGWRAVFVAISAGAAVTTLLVFLAARTTDLPDAGAADRNLLRATRREWRTVLTGVVLLGVTGFVWQGVFNFYELYMTAKGLSASVAPNLLTVIFAAGVPAFMVSGRLADRFPHVPYMLAILAAFVACLVALVSVSGLFALVAVSAVLGFVIHSLFPAMDTYLLDTLPDESRGSAYAAYSGTMMVVQATGSSVVGALRDAGYAFDAVFSVCAVGLTGLLVGFVLAQRAGLLPE